MVNALKQPEAEEDQETWARKLKAIEDNYGQDADSSAEDANIARARTHIDSHGDEVPNNPNADPVDVKDQEESAKAAPTPLAESEKTREGFGARFRRGFKKNGASGGIIGMIVGGFITSSFFFLPGSLLATIEKALTNDGSDATRTNIVMRKAYVGGLFSKASCKTVACEKLTMMSEEQRKTWEKQGFKIEPGEVRNGRIRVASITFPDGDVVRSPAEYDAKLKNSLPGRVSADNVVNVRSSFFQNSKFKKVLEKFDIAKGKYLKAATDKNKEARTEKMAQSFDENTKAITGADVDARTTKIKTETTESSKFKGSIDKINDKVSKSNPATIAISSVCAIYNVARVTTATVKAKYIYDLVNFAFPFVQAASQIYYFGSIAPELAEYLGDKLTWYQNEAYTQELAAKAGTAVEKQNILAKEGKTAMDSQGLQMAIFGDFTKLQEFTKQYTTGALGATIATSSAITKIQNLVGKENIHDICVANSYIGLASSAFCLSNPLSAVVCGVGAAGIIILGPKIAEEAVKELSEPAIKFIATANLNSSLRGVDAGNALAAGIGLMLMNSSMGYGLLMASNVDDVKNFISATDQDYYQNGEELARYEAKSTPFDVNNRYSFMGQIASAFNPYRSGDGTLFSQILNGFAVVSSPLTKMSTASALYSQPSNMTLEQDSDPTKDSATNRLGKMVDPDLQSIGAVNDWSGRFVGITPPAVLGKMAGQAIGQNTAIADNVDYMVSNGYINPDGTTKADSEYAKYQKYWTEKREDPPGTTSEPVTEGTGDDEGWFTAENLVYKKDRDPKQMDMINNFITYNNMCESQYATAENVNSCTDDTPFRSAGNVTPSTCAAGGGSQAIYTCALKYDNYRYKWGGGHGDVPNATQWIADFNAGKIPEWTPILDCSGLVRMAFVEAMGIEDQAYTAPGGYDSSKNWQKIPLEQAQQGDIVTSSGHVAIVESNDTAARKFKIFDAETANAPQEDNIRHSTQSYGGGIGSSTGGTIAAYRAKKG